MSARAGIEWLKHARISYYRELGARHRLLAPIIVPAKRALRRALKFLLAPMAAELNDYHARLADTLGLLERGGAALAEETRERLGLLERENAALRAALEGLAGGTRAELDAIYRDAAKHAGEHEQLTVDRHKYIYGTAETGAGAGARSSLAKWADIAEHAGYARELGFCLGREDEWHRKTWEWVYILRALHESGALKKGARGLGFAVGKEPLPAAFAKYGVKVTATDLAGKAAGYWKGTGQQHADGLSALERPDICDNGTFYENVCFKTLDMNNIPDSPGGYDFCWSSCAFEHLGGEEKGRAFILNTLKILKPGGISVHTTEFSLSSAGSAAIDENTLVYGRQFFEALRGEVSGAGHYFAPPDYRLGSRPEDDRIFKFAGAPQHFKVLLGGCIATSIGITIVKKGGPEW